MLHNKFLLEGKVCIITGGAGLLGKCHLEAVLEGKGVPVLIGRTKAKLEQVKNEYEEKYHLPIEIFAADITDKALLQEICSQILLKYGHVDVLINNAANNPKVEAKCENFSTTKFEDLPIAIWEKDINVGLTGAFLCCQVFGKAMEKQKSGVILNISSDYGILAPDQRIYKKDYLSEQEQTIKPVTYCVVKHGLIGLTKYLATYWGAKGIRVNTLCPSGIYDHQDEEFVDKFVYGVPMGRMSTPEDYPATILYMISEASSFLNGATIVIDGGKSIW